MKEEKQIQAAILTVSTRGAKGERLEDTSGETIREMLQKIAAEVVDYQIIPDDKENIVRELRRLAGEVGADLILTTGGTGLSPTDVTPEATLAVIERRVPGFEEAMRQAGFSKTPFAILSRAVAGTFGKTLIINLPGNPKGVRENLEAILTVIPHAVKVLRGGLVQDSEHQFKAGGSK